MTADLLPPSATPQERSISLSVDRAVPVPNATLWSPWTCPVDILPWLAWALSVDEWDAGASEIKKRQLIANSVEHHRAKGTVSALKRALQTLGYEVEINEQTGTAYCFSLGFKIDSGSAGGSVLEAAVDRATEIALRQKNARSKLISSNYVAQAPAIGGPKIVTLTISGCETEMVNTSTAATLLVDTTGADNTLIFTATIAGTSGNSISIEITSPSGYEITVSVSGTAITVHPAAKGSMLFDGMILPLVWYSDGKPWFETFGPGFTRYSAKYSSLLGWSLTSPTGGWTSNQNVASPDLVTSWTPVFGTTGSPPPITPLASTASNVISVVNGDPTASALVIADAVGASTGTVSAFTATNLSGGL